MTRAASRRPLITGFLAGVLVLGAAVPAAAATRPPKLEVLASFTQAGAASFADWNAARKDRGKWSSYDFDWRTDHCSLSPDRPLGFDFSLACWRHDFGYRNYRDAGLFAEAKDRLDTAMYADLKRACAGYERLERPACLSLAWTYYQAVKYFGTPAGVTAAELKEAAELSSAGHEAVNGMTR
ncbi:phospholipase [Actinoplanes sp. NBRC 101535]|uniref:phospholipase n=1 Tax=Actinoplanes sp. NBRC 101535 TaxID=3032196 RepID=UPI0024A13AC3|nr:phospholipase [Actinoplanes sp. NBRC 101535]GLY00169.1 hypothetical protein Acsp01_05480 [Actinoplanes sp. NBRC 101535]